MPLWTSQRNRPTTVVRCRVLAGTRGGGGRTRAGPVAGRAQAVATVMVPASGRPAPHRDPRIPARRAAPERGFRGSRRDARERDFRSSRADRPVQRPQPPACAAPAPGPPDPVTGAGGPDHPQKPPHATALAARGLSV
ncbi:hypothetical protein SGPA1_20978 [Streptomyces misionensis JCM 4497]